MGQIPGGVCYSNMMLILMWSRQILMWSFALLTLNMVAGCEQNIWMSETDVVGDDHDIRNTSRPLLWTNSLPRRAKRSPGEFGFYERTESCYDLTTLDFATNRRTKQKSCVLVRTQSGQIVPPRQRKKSSATTSGSSPAAPALVRTQSGQIVPPRLKKSRSNIQLECRSNEEEDKQTKRLDKVPPTPPKRKKHLQMEKINQLFMNFVGSCNGQEGMQLGKESNLIQIVSNSPLRMYICTLSSIIKIFVAKTMSAKLN